MPSHLHEDENYPHFWKYVHSPADVDDVEIQLDENQLGTYTNSRP